MKRILLFILTTIFYLGIFAQGVPELMYYKFDGTGQTAVPNLASSPVGTNPAPFVGTALSQGPTGQFGNALIGAGASSTTDYLNTGWNTSLSGDWTISFWCSNIQPSGTLWYIFGNTSNSFRCFTNGVAGANNWILRGTGITDVLVPGGAVVASNVIHFVYDNSVPEIRAYLNGVLVNTVPQTTINLTATDPFKVGAQSATGLAPGGLMDEFRMYNHALSQAEITTTWNQPLPLVTGPKDMSVSNLISPSAVGGCVASAIDTFSVNVYNFGSDTVFFDTDTVQITGITSGPNPQTYTVELNSGFMAPGSSMPVVITPNYDISAPGLHIFNAYVEFLSGGPDANLANDTMATATVLNPNGSVGAGQAFAEDIETWGVGSPGTVGSGWTISSTSTASAAAAGWHVEEDGVANSGSTGPIDDHTPGGSQYMFTETSSGATGDMFTLTSPCIDLSNATAPRLSFWYHMYGAAMGTLEAHITTPNGFDSLVAIFVGQQQFAEADPWLQSVSNLDFVIDSIIQIEFVGIRGTTFTSDMAIDDINLFDAIPIDAKANGLVAPAEA
ncbi:MAG: hypothetical protein KDD63_03100, partial [Bacteroidetes bacterium]|nr:hypothetical protein [Bacteroidota bacterium]